MTDIWGLNAPTAPEDTPSPADNGFTLGHLAKLVANELGRGVASVPGFAADVMGNLAFPALAQSPAKILSGTSGVSDIVNKSYTAAAGQVAPQNKVEEYAAPIAQGVGSALAGGPEADIWSLGKTILSGGAAGVAAKVAQDYTNSPLASTVAGLGAALVTHKAASIWDVNAPKTEVDHGMAHPDFNTLANEVVPTLEGGGTVEAPKTNPKSGAFGPMQVTPETLQQPGYGIKPWDGTVADSVRVGQQKLAVLLHRYDGDVDKTLAAYNWGEGNVDRVLSEHGAEWLNHVPEETFNYVHKGWRLLGGVDTPGSVNGSVESMAPEDIKSVMDNPLMQEGAEPNDLERLRSVSEAHQNMNDMLDNHVSEAQDAIEAIHSGDELPLSPQEISNFQDHTNSILEQMQPNDPLRYKAEYAQKLWQQVQDAVNTGKPPVDESLPNASVAKVMGEPRTVEAANENPPQEPPSGGRGGGSGMGGDFGGGNEQPPAEGEPKYADSVNLNRIKITQDAKQLIKDQLLPANTDIETHEENKVKAMSYIDRHGAENILSGFHKVEPDELSAYQTAVRALSAAGKQNVVDLANNFPDENNRTPAQVETLKNAIEMSGRATTLDNTVAKQLGRSMSARRIYMGGNAELSKLLDGAHIDNDALNKLVDKINAMPSQAGDIAADAMKPGWLDYVKSAYYGISLLSRLSTPIGIFASVGASHITEALTHTVASMVTMPGEARAWGSWAKGWAKGFDDLPDNIKQAWQQGIPTDKASLIQSRVNLPGVLGFPSKMIASVDEFFGTLGRSAKAYSDAGQRAYSEGFRGDKFTARVNELVKNMTPAEEKIVTDYGKFARLQDAPTPLGRLFKAAVNNKNAMISLPATVVLPFVNIADRLFMYSIRMTPGLSFTDKLTQRDFAASPTGKAVAINRQLIGAGLGAYTVSQVIAGNITGQGPADPNKKAQWLVNHQPDSVKIGDKWVSYTRMPFSGLMSAAATATERYQETGNGQGYIKAIEGMFIGAGAGLLHSHYLEGVANLADTLNSGSSDKLADFFGRTVKSFIPGIEQAANEALVDPNVRDTKGSPFVDNIKAGLMGASQTLPAKHDVYGNPIQYEGGISRLVNPFPTKSIPQDAVINDVGNINEKAPGSVITTAPKSVNVNDVKQKLSEGDYQKYQVLSGRYIKEGLMNNPSWRYAPQDEKVKIIKDIQSNARERARNELQLGTGGGHPGDIWAL